MSDPSIYEVLDAASPGLQMQVEFQPRANYALAVGGLPCVRAVVVHNETAHEWGSLTITGKLATGPVEDSVFTIVVPGPHAPGQTVRVADERITSAFLPLLAASAEVSSAKLSVSVSIPESPTGPLSASVTLSAANEFLNWPALHAALATFVQPDAREVTSILQEASDTLLTHTGDGLLGGYRTLGGRPMHIAGAIYESIRSLGITYLNPPASFEFTGQSVRTAQRVIADHCGSCIDLAVMYAACMEAAGLHPVIFTTQDHAFAGFYTSEYYGDRPVHTSPQLIAQLVEAGHIIPVELTGINPGFDVVFRDSVKQARAYFTHSGDLVRTMVDVAASRLNNVMPLPLRTPAGEVDRVAAATAISARSWVAHSRLPHLAQEQQSAGRVRDQLDREDSSPAQFHRWKSELLDLSPRNPLLNLPHSHRVIDLVMPSGMLPLLDDVLHDGKKVRLFPHDGVDELMQTRGIRVASEMAPEAMKSRFRSMRVLHTLIDASSFRAALTRLRREADTREQETGTSSLYLTLGSLIHTRANGEEARAPLFLLPIKLRGLQRLGDFTITVDGGDIASVNRCLTQWLAATAGVRLPALDTPEVDDSGLAVESILTRLRASLTEHTLPFRIEEDASIALLPFPAFQIWKDLDDNWETLYQNPLVRHLVDRPGETFIDPRANVPAVVNESSIRLPLAADGSQLRAIARANAGQSFVLEGPPGTGKSQTITNLIVHLLREGKKVLFVAEKQAALEVVRQRLDSSGVAPFTLELHGQMQSMNAIRGQLRRALEARAPATSAGWSAEDARLRSTTTELSTYPQRVHGTNAAGHSLWSAFDELGALGPDGPIATVSPVTVSSGNLDRESALSTAQAFQELALRFPFGTHHPWALTGPIDPTQLTADALAAALHHLVRARTQVAALTPDARQLLSRFHPGGELTAALRLVSGWQRGCAPSPDTLPTIVRPGWGERVDAALRGLKLLRERHADVISRVRPEAYDDPAVPGLLAESAALDGAWFFPELRRQKIVARVTPLLSPSAPTGPVLRGAEVTRLLQSIRDVAAESPAVSALLIEAPGLTVPPSWRPYNPQAEEDLAESRELAELAVWVSQHAPGSVPILATLPPTDVAILAEIDRAWQGWLGALGAPARNVSRWAPLVGPLSRDWVEAWAQDLPRWQSDIATTGALSAQHVAGLALLCENLANQGLHEFADELMSGTIAAVEAPTALLRGIATASLAERGAAAQINVFDAVRQDLLAGTFPEQGQRVREMFRRVLVSDILSQRPFNPEQLRGEVADLQRQIERSRGGMPFRELTTRFPHALTSLTPCILTSPEALAHHLDPRTLHVDVVIFDEASRIPITQTIGAMGRADSVIIVGDSQQVPPTRTMRVETVTPQAEIIVDELVVENRESILTAAIAAGLPRERLTWHYRSADEKLIAFSNANYYNDSLTTLPSPQIAAASTPRMSSLSAAQHGTGLSWRRVSGTFDRGSGRTNLVEAQAVVHEIQTRLRNPRTRNQSIGVVCLNAQQRDLILTLLESNDDLLVQQALGLGDTGSTEPLFVKDMESVQGDERDVILFSLVLSPDSETGNLPLTSGPLAREGGQLRLNVAITRARTRVVLFSSFDPAAIDLSRSTPAGLRDLRGYLEFVAAESDDSSGRSTAPAAPVPLPTDSTARFVSELTTELRGRGLIVANTVGRSAFRVDLAIRRANARSWELAVLVDGPEWASRPTVADRDGAPALLESRMGWRSAARVWLPAWLRDRSAVVERLMSLLANPDGATVAKLDEFDPLVFEGEAVVSNDSEVGPSALTPSHARLLPLRGESPALSRVASLIATNQNTADPTAPEEENPEDEALTVADYAPTILPFVAADTGVIASQSALNNIIMATPAVESYAAEALATEGPIELGRLALLVAKRFGFSRIGPGRRDELSRVITARFTTTHDEGTFVWPDGISPDNWRDAYTVEASGDRTVNEVSVQEIANAMCILLRESFSMSPEELDLETSRALGYSRANEATKSRFRRALTLAITSGRVAHDGDRYLPGIEPRDTVAAHR
ncbi:DUF3320 domain-containing protein [Klugiella xanthotipulae]|uniref:AAA domain-containing protein n=1 Tax=Klugiella xanthotipulae TaxID=244735 RepID=A0A543HT53_9MICO|nr:DUF4011 domain-containing protein [Klugiella xanthotipulae]TQM61536.1 AAA domain-containing protein [Klugiella xanthotipulae]